MCLNVSSPQNNKPSQNSSGDANDEQSEVLAIWQEIERRMRSACVRSGRDADSLTLLGATKTVSAARLRAFIAAGLTDVGENYVQEGIAKKTVLNALPVRWHLIGALQSKKAKIAVREFEVIHSVDRASLAQALNKAAREANKVQDVLLQVNLGDEDSKAGCAPDQLMELAHYCAPLEHLCLGGLMCLPPYDEDPEKTRPYFRQLRELRDELRGQNWRGARDCQELSMGMSDDFEVAIEEGATIIRLGTALFGRRVK